MRGILRRLLGGVQAPSVQPTVKREATGPGPTGALAAETGANPSPAALAMPSLNLAPPEPFWLDAASLTDVGTVRSNNEDAVRLLPNAGQGIRLAVLADGMGGHACGEVASALAIDAVMVHMRTLDEQRLTPAQWLDQLGQAVQAANTAIWQHAQNHPEATGMGTTLCVLSVAHGHAYWAWVGDSRVYLWQGGMLTLLTRDDTIVNRMLDEGTLTAEQAAKHPDSHVLSQALGTHEAVERVNVCGHPFKLTAGDRLIMTSDGVHDLLPFEQWGICLSQSAPHEAAGALIEAGKLAGSADNLSAVVVDVCPPRDTSQAPAATRH